MEKRGGGGSPLYVYLQSKVVYKVFSFLFQVPQLFIGTKYIGGEKELIRMHESGQLKKVFEENK